MSKDKSRFQHCSGCWACCRSPLSLAFKRQASRRALTPFLTKKSKKSLTAVMLSFSLFSWRASREILLTKKSRSLSKRSSHFWYCSWSRAMTWALVKSLRGFCQRLYLIPWARAKFSSWSMSRKYAASPASASPSKYQSGIKRRIFMMLKRAGVSPACWRSLPKFSSKSTKGWYFICCCRSSKKGIWFCRKIGAR